MFSVPRWRLHLLFAAMGFAAMAAQVLLLRRAVIAMGGSELVAGGILAGWLAAGGLGNLVAGRFADRLRDPPCAAGFALLLLAAAVPATLAAFALAKPLLGIPPPVMPGPAEALALAAILLMPLGLAIGMSFTLACRLPEAEEARSIARVYLFDAVGAGCGGLAVSLAIARHVAALPAALLLCALLAAACGLAIRRRPVQIAALALVALVGVGLLASGVIDAALTRLAWRGYNPVVQRESLLAHLMVTENQGERTLFVDGRPVFSLPLPETYESIAHLPLVEHGAPRDVVLIEGGISGTLSQWRQWPLASAQFLRLDPEVTALERDEMPSAIQELPPWATIRHGDGRRLLRAGVPGDCRSACADVLVVDVGTPDTAGSDRYYTADFFREAAAFLRPDGVLCLALLTPGNVVSREVAELLGGIQATLAEVFPNVVLAPLDRFYFFASRGEAKLTADPAELSRRLAEHGIAAPTLAARILPGIFPERIASMQEAVAAAARTASIDRDRQPRAYFNGMLLWERRFGEGGRTFAEIASTVRPWMGGVLLAFLLALSLRAAGPRSTQLAAAWSLAAIGFASIVAEIVLLIHCQMVEGLMVWRMGFIVTAFMVGAGAGTWGAACGVVAIARRRAALLSSLAIGAITMLLVLPAGSAGFVQTAFLLGLLCGFVYQTSVTLLFSARGAVGATAGFAQTADLWGSAAGAIAASFLVVPLYGLFGALLMAAIVLAAAWLVVALRSR